MSYDLAIQAASVDRLASINSLTPLSLASATPINAATLIDSASSIVQLSALGKLLAASATLETSLKTIAASTRNATASSVLAEAQSFVSAFNAARQSINNVLPILDTLPGNEQIALLAQTLDAAATSTTSEASQNLSGLQAIGISFVTTSTTDSGESTTRLSIDQTALNAAAIANPEGAASLLAQATQSLLPQVSTFQAQMTSATGLPNEFSVLVSALTSNDGQDLTTAEVLNNIQLANLALTAQGLEIDKTKTADAIREAALSNGLSGPTSTNDTLTIDAVKPLVTTSKATATLPTVTPSSTTLQTAAVTTPTTSTVSQSITQSQVASTSTTLLSEQTTAEATLALQKQMADSALRNVILDPSYAALIASSHLTDFTAPMPSIRSRAFPLEIPAAILAISRVSAISSYQDAANGFVHH